MKIAIVKLSALGDIVHAMVVLQFIKEFNQEISIDWVVEEAYKDLLESNPDINQIHITNLRKAKKKKSLHLLLNELSRLRKLGPYDVVIDMQGLIKSAIITKLIPSQKTVGFDKFSIREKLAAIFYQHNFHYSYEKNIIERNIALIQFAIGVKVDHQQILDKTSFLFYKSKEINIEISNLKKNIILVPGASNKSKQYPASKLAELTNLIDANFFVIWGNDEEKALAKKIKSISTNSIVLNKTSINDLILLFSKVDLVIGPDTGPTHLAWALNIPSITLFGSTPGYRNTYITNINKILESTSSVNPQKINNNDYSISDIKSENIVEIAKNLLK